MSSSVSPSAARMYAPPMSSPARGGPSPRGSATNGLHSGLNMSAAAGGPAHHHHHAAGSGGQGGALVNVSQGGGTMSGERPPETRASTVHHHLLVAEREITDLREETALKAAELDALRVALQREHETNLRQHSKHNQDMEHMRNEYERQNSQLVEQLTVLKGVSEASAAEKIRITEEANHRKQQLMSLLERERDEKAQIMADYRTQTEGLISEQGREITGLRTLLETAREEEDKLVSASKKQEDRRMEAEDLVIKLEGQLADEKVAAQRRLREYEQRHQSQLETVRHQNELDGNDLRAQILKANTQRDSTEDQLRSLNEKIKSHDAASEAEKSRLRAAYDTDIDSLAEELKSVKSVKEITEMSLRQEIDRSQRSHDDIVQNLRREVDVVRHERQSATDEYRVQKEILLAEQARRTNELQQIADNARKEFQEERVMRKNAETEKHSTALENDQLKQNNSRLGNELENLQLDTRTKERATEHAHLEQLEALRNSLRSLEAEHSALKQRAQKSEVETQRAADAAQSKIVHLEAEQMDYRRKSEALRISLDDAVALKEEAVKHATNQVDTLTTRKVHLEAENNRLERALTESEARGVAATKQLSNERRALEQATTDMQHLKIQFGDLRAQMEAERSKLTQALESIAMKEEELNQIKEIMDEQSNEIREVQRQNERLRSDIDAMDNSHEATVANLKNSHRREVSGFEEELSQANNARRAHQQAHTQAEEQLKNLREEVTQWERECINKDEIHAENMRSEARDHEEELLRMDTVVNTLRDDLARSQSAKANAQRDAGDAARDVDRRVQIVQEALENERTSKQRLNDELRAKEQLAAEVQGTVRLLTTRLASKEDDIQRLDSELQEVSTRVHEAHSIIGRKDATLGQLTAKLRVYESRGTL